MTPTQIEHIIERVRTVYGYRVMAGEQGGVLVEAPDYAPVPLTWRLTPTEVGLRVDVAKGIGDQRAPWTDTYIGRTLKEVNDIVRRIKSDCFVPWIRPENPDVDPFDVQQAFYHWLDNLCPAAITRFAWQEFVTRWKESRVPGPTYPTIAHVSQLRGAIIAADTDASDGERLLTCVWETPVLRTVVTMHAGGRIFYRAESLLGDGTADRIPENHAPALLYRTIRGE